MTGTRLRVSAGMLVVTAALMLWPAASVAAVRRCADVIAIAGQERRVVLDARASAIRAWIDQARTLGEGYTAWRLANARDVRCGAGPAGGIQCLATARPCTIEQAPQRRP